MTAATLPISSSDRLWVEDAWSRTASKLQRTSLRIKDSFPHASHGGRYDDAAVDWWTNGFWPGMLWMLDAAVPDPRLRSYAESCEAKLDAPLHGFELLHHDVGFMWMLTSAASFKRTGSAVSRRRALHAASILASRFNLNGRFIRAWNWDDAGWTIIDCMMNLPLLFWASEELKDPRFRQIAMAHADTVMAHFVDADGACRHLVQFDAERGGFVQALAGQGHAADSAWSRGASWAVYGFALCARYTGERRYAETAVKVADFFLRSLPVDRVPPWDFRAPAPAPLDSSAAAICAGGLLELARLETVSAGKDYAEAAVSLLRALDGRCGAWELDEEALLLHATGFFSRGSNVDVPLIYGDFFFVEALARLCGHWTPFT